MTIICNSKQCVGWLNVSFLTALLEEWTWPTTPLQKHTSAGQADDGCSFQTWRSQWTNTTAARWAPPGTWAMKGRETHWQMCDATSLCPMGDSPVLAAEESMHTARHRAARAHRHFVTRNKGAVQTSSFVYDWLKGFFLAIGQEHSNGVCKCSGNVLLLHLCQYQKDALTGYLVRESSASNRMLLKASKLALKHLTCQKTKVAFTKPLKVHPTSSEHWSILTGEYYDVP